MKTNQRIHMHVFNISDRNGVDSLNTFVENHHVVDIKMSTAYEQGKDYAKGKPFALAIALYTDDDKSAIQQIKYFNVHDYCEKGGLKGMEKDINDFCTKHEIVSIHQDNDGVATIVYLKREK